MISNGLKVMARLILLLIVTAVVGMTVLVVIPYLPEPTYAVDNKSFDNTNVMDDLSGADVGDNKFNLNDYPYIEGGRTPKLMNFVEYCYSFRKSAREHFGLYLYIYNQQGLNIEESSVQNKVQLATSYNSDGTPNGYSKFSLKFCSKSTKPGYENLFYKYKIIDMKSVDGNYIIDRVNASERRYDVSGFELLTKGASTAIDYKVGGTYKFKGYTKGCGADPSSESSLTSVVNNLETIQLDVRNAYWRNNMFTTSFGQRTQDEITSVYFGVDDKVLKEYGKLQKIHASWYEFKSKPILVTNNDGLFSEMQNYIGRNVGVYDNTIPLNLYSGKVVTPGQNHFNSSYYDFSWNIFLENRFDLGYSITSKKPVSQIPYLFKSDGFVSSDVIEEYTYGYNKSYVNGTVDIKSNPVSLDLFTDKGTFKEVNIDVDNKFDITNSPSSVFDTYGLGGWLAGLLGLKKYPSYPDIKMIETIPKDVFFGESVASKYFVSSDYVSEFKEYCSTATGNKKTVFLFRYKISDYATIPKVGFTKNYVATDNVGYVAEMGIDLDFDIIDLTFNKDGIYTIIPVVSNPIDIFNDVTPPSIITNTNWLMVILGFVIMVLVLIVFAPILKPVFKFVGKVISAPFRRNKK